MSARGRGSSWSEASVSEGPRSSSTTVVELPYSGSDEQLLAWVRQDGARAKRAIVDRFAVDVHRTIWRLTGPDPEHDDLAQQAFARVFKGIARVREPAKLRAWIIAIAVNTARTELRRRKLRRLVGIDTLREYEVPHADDPHEVHDLVRRTYALLDRLPFDERAVFVLRFVERRTVPDIARVLQCSSATVSRRLRNSQDRFARLVRREPALAEWLRREGADAEVRREGTQDGDGTDEGEDTDGPA